MVSTSGGRFRGTSWGKMPGSNSGPRSLVQQYDALDQNTKLAFNEQFLKNLENVKYSMGQLISQHVNKEQSRDAIQLIFPPQAYGYAGKENPPMIDSKKAG